MRGVARPEASAAGCDSPSAGFISSVDAIGSEVAMPAMDVAASDSQTAISERRERNMEIKRRLGNFEWAL